jgi:hypothetical protein
MHLDLIESLRCPNAHDDGWLVAIPDVVRERVMWSGEIGCPQCATTWRVHEGVLVLDFASETTAAGAASSRVPGATLRDSGSPATASCAPGSLESEALRTAALLDLRTPGGAVLLAGSQAHHAAALAALVPDVLVLTLNAPPDASNVHGHLRAEPPLPLGVGTLRGARLDGTHADAVWLPGVLRALARGARVIAPVAAAQPPETRELARDEREWVAEVSVAASGLVPLRRGGDPMLR